VIHGYITSYFSLYVSAFYGQLIRPDAMIYIMRSIDQGTPEPDYPLDFEDVEAILRDQGSSVLVERSMFNIGILDHLLVSDTDGAATVIQNLVDSSDEGSMFIDLYVDGGHAKAAFIDQLAPRMPGLFTYLASNAPLERWERVRLIDTAIAHRSREFDYHLSDELRRFIEDEYRSFPSLAPAAGARAAKDAVQFIASTGAVVPELAGLSEPAIDAFKETRAYSLTKENLESVTGATNLSLDAIFAVQREVFAYAADSIQAYLQAFSASEATPFTIASPDSFTDILNVSKGWTDCDFAAVVTGASRECSVARLALVPSPAWPVLVRTHRVPMSFENASAYVEDRGEVDAELAVALGAVDAITDLSEAKADARAQLALEILNAPSDGLGADRRVKLAVSLNPGVLDANSVEPLAGPLVGELIASRLIADDEEAFSERLMVDWDTQAHAVAHSANFVDFVSAETLQAQFIAPLLRSGDLSSLHPAVVAALPSFTGVPRDAFVAAAQRALEGAFVVDAANIEMMRRGGVGTNVTIQLLAAAANRVSTSELRQILRTLGSPWSKVADPGWGVHEIEDAPAAHAVLLRLRDAKVVSKLPSNGAVRRVSLRQP
jgi:hypothetical protein